MQKLTAAVVTLLLCVFAVEANQAADSLATPTKQQASALDVELHVSLKYLLYFPPDYDQHDNWPLLLFLHGGGERGDDLKLVTRHGPPKLIEQGKQFPFIVVTPQCPADGWWHPNELIALLDDIAAKYKVDADRISVTGLSLGGFGTWELAAYAPDRFAAIVPICGGGETYRTKRMANLATWVFHGAQDAGVPLRRSQDMVEALMKEGGNVKFTIYPDAPHDSWTATYNNPAVYEWLLQQRRQPVPKPK